MSIKEYRLTSMEEPTDAMLHELMYQVACSARQSSYNAKQVLKQKMQKNVVYDEHGKEKERIHLDHTVGNYDVWLP